jgi:hypothetical protein
MERFRFGEQEGPNGAKYTRNGWLAVWGGEGLELKTGRCSLEVAGPKGAVRAVVVMDKATAGKLGAALLTWAMPENKSLRAHLDALLLAVEAVNKAKPATAWRGAWGFDFIPRFEGDFPGNPGGKKEAMKAAIEARENGEWDHPSLIAIGPLTSTSADIAEIKRFYAD